MNIYINAQNTRSLNAEDNKSGLVNRLLKEYYTKGTCKCEAFPVIHSHLETDGESYAIRPEGFHHVGTDPAKVNGDVSVEQQYKGNDLVIPFKKSRLATPTPEETESKLKSFAKDKGMKFCANGHAIPAGRSKCMGKGCKYAK